MSDKMMVEMKRRLREIMKGKPVGSPNSKEVEDMIVQVGKDMGVFKSDTPKKMRDGGRVSDRDKMKMKKIVTGKPEQSYPPPLLSLENQLVYPSLSHEDDASFLPSFYQTSPDSFKHTATTSHNCTAVFQFLWH